MKKLYAIFVCLLFFGTILPAAANVAAPKPEKPPGGGGGPTPTGTIYFSYNDGTDYSVWTMNPDGSDKTKVTLVTTGVGILSRLKHGDHYWYIGFAAVDGTYPDGFQRYELFATRDDNGKTLQLTDDATLSISFDGVQPVWGPDDGLISWPAKRFSGDTVTEAGVYTASTNFNSNGDLTSIGTVGLVWECDLWYQSSTGMYHPVIGILDWSPDGTKLVVKHGGLYIVDLSANSETYLTDGIYQQWSPDGNKIAFISFYDDLRTIDPDGSNEQIIAEPKDIKKAGTWQDIDSPRWSPDSKFLIYYVWQHSSQFITHKHWIYRTDANGDHQTCLTNNLVTENYKDTVGWR